MLIDFSATKFQKRSEETLKNAGASLGTSYEFIAFENKNIIYKHLECGTLIKKTIGNFKFYPKCPNAACKAKRTKATNMKKWGVENPLHSKVVQDKIKKTNQIKFGVDYPLQSDVIKNKIKNTVNKRYGVDYPLQSDVIKNKIKTNNVIKHGTENPASTEEVKNKIKTYNIEKYGVKSTLSHLPTKNKIRKTNIKKYGTSYPLQNDKVKEKIKKTNLKKYGTIYPLQNKKVIEKGRQTKFSKFTPKLKEKLEKYGYELLDSYKGMAVLKNKVYDHHKKYNIKHLKCGTIFQDDVFSLPRCPKCFKQAGISQQEKFYVDYIKSLEFDIIENDRKLLDGKEIDIYLPEQKIGFEFNGIYYHTSNRKNKRYHQDKTNLAIEKGIKLYHIWEFMDKDIVCSKINILLHKNVTKLYARNMTVKDVPKEEEREFLDRTHLYGFVPSKVCKGLYDSNNVLVSLMSFRGNTEIARAASSLNTIVIGGFSKLLKSTDFNNLFTYADRDWSPIVNETVYNKLGLQLVGDTGPSLFYSNGRQVWSRQKFQKHKLEELFPDIWDPELTADQILSIKSIYPFYTSGNWKFKA